MEPHGGDRTQPHEQSGARGAVTAARPELKRERVREHLLTVIDARRPGDAIPSERTLCATLGVSRPTLRAAVDELVATGLLVREHGRGMFVAPAKITQELVAEQHTADAPRGQGGWTSRVLELRTVRAGARIGRKLTLSPAAELVHVTRLRYVDGDPIALEHLHVPADLVPGLTVADMEGGFYAHLREKRGIRTAHAVQSIEPTVLSEEEAALLEVPVLSPALLFDRITSDTGGRPVEYVRSLYRGDRYRIVSRLALRDGAADHPAADAGPAGAWWGTVE
ncbi:putative transcriptional regulator of N-Acetylglucosamine utilization, GntR family [Streptomyces venezuelae]|uniref:GntR family transcriptional regulator n=1 Tax=Streptomyces gardneri TaxID=66892 RepID=UPI0006BCB434|nr:GntR family transcriptional regulator [Streptomyces gardneri]ALO06154.1 putative transcriptional regulator of N-Acetylglucosamine utilization, GntR family [Streptomyces venezuelae]QPK43628.1 GntR family transcriptional regulator [Streptomyces gardneri]WRK34879.1 GntR family transcriptional regulator [Streptomyces venezuelae]CUM43602.1 Predicted transcriptional regulator of N-Acetylglucosamine utilization, GntR family [Streptomyces venezuelae]